jgi:type IV pilus assembly protein PilC
MPTFAYEAMNASGKAQKGTMDAASSDEVIQKLRGDGMFPTSVREAKAAGKAEKPKAEKAKKKRKIGFSMPGGVSAKTLTLFTRQMSTLQDAGLPLLRSLQILEQQQKPGKMKTILGKVCEDVEGGNTLSESFSRHPKAFDRLYCKMSRRARSAACSTSSCSVSPTSWRRASA